LTDVPVECQRVSTKIEKIPEKETSKVAQKSDLRPISEPLSF